MGELVEAGTPLFEIARIDRVKVVVHVSELEIATAVAEQLGYASEAAFSRAYKRTTGTPPGAVRRRHRPSDADLLTGGFG